MIGQSITAVTVIVQPVRLHHEDCGGGGEGKGQAMGGLLRLVGHQSEGCQVINRTHKSLPDHNGGLEGQENETSLFAATKVNFD